MINSSNPIVHKWINKY